MIRFALAASLFVTAAQAETPKQEDYSFQNLAFCGSQVATLAWFYQGAVNDGSPELQPELDGLLAMQSIFISQVERSGDETIELFKTMTKASVAELAEQMQGTQDDGARALSDVNISVRGCADLYFEEVEDDADAAEKTKEN